MASKGKEEPTLEEQLKKLLAKKCNQVCADCDELRPRWASVNLGVFICINCSGRHRGLGVHISEVRSVTLDTWKPQWLAVMKKWGNENANSVYEYALKAGYQRDGTDRYVRAKYEQQLFVDPKLLDAPSASSAAATAAGTSTSTTAHPSKGGEDGKKKASKQELVTTAKATKKGPPVGGGLSQDEGDAVFESFAELNNPFDGSDDEPYERKRSPMKKQSKSAKKAKKDTEGGDETDKKKGCAGRRNSDSSVWSEGMYQGGGSEGLSQHSSDRGSECLFGPKIVLDKAGTSGKQILQRLSSKVKISKNKNEGENGGAPHASTTTALDGRTQQQQQQRQGGGEEEEEGEEDFWQLNDVDTVAKSLKEKKREERKLTKQAKQEKKEKKKNSQAGKKKAQDKEDGQEDGVGEQKEKKKNKGLRGFFSKVSSSMTRMKENRRKSLTDANAPSKLEEEEEEVSGPTGGQKQEVEMEDSDAKESRRMRAQVGTDDPFDDGLCDDDDDDDDDEGSDAVQKKMKKVGAKRITAAGGKKSPKTVEESKSQSSSSDDDESGSSSDGSSSESSGSSDSSSSEDSCGDDKMDQRAVAGARVSTGQQQEKKVVAKTAMPAKKSSPETNALSSTNIANPSNNAQNGRANKPGTTIASSTSSPTPTAKKAAPMTTSVPSRAAASPLSSADVASSSTRGSPSVAPTNKGKSNSSASSSSSSSSFSSSNKTSKSPISKAIPAINPDDAFGAFDLMFVSDATNVSSSSSSSSATRSPPSQQQPASSLQRGSAQPLQTAAAPSLSNTMPSHLPDSNKNAQTSHPITDFISPPSALAQSPAGTATGFPVTLQHKVYSSHLEVPDFVPSQNASPCHPSLGPPLPGDPLYDPLVYSLDPLLTMSPNAFTSADQIPDFMPSAAPPSATTTSTSTTAMDLLDDFMHGEDASSSSSSSSFPAGLSRAEQSYSVSSFDPLSSPLPQEGQLQQQQARRRSQPVTTDDDYLLMGMDLLRMHSQNNNSSHGVGNGNQGPLLGRTGGISRPDSRRGSQLDLLSSSSSVITAAAASASGEDDIFDSVFSAGNSKAEQVTVQPQTAAALGGGVAGHAACHIDNTDDDAVDLGALFGFR